jgi:hypothetical protein
MVKHHLPDHDASLAQLASVPSHLNLGVLAGNHGQKHRDPCTESVGDIDRFFTLGSNAT